MKYVEILKTVKLFKDIKDAEFEAMLNCMGKDVKDVKKDEIILMAGDKPRHIGIVLRGQCNIIKENHEGKRSLIAALTSGEIFAEALCCAGVTQSPVSVIAGIDSTIMMLNFSRLLQTCPNSCSYHTKLIENMLWLIANKNLLLQSHMEIISIRSVREKVMHYLESFVPKQGLRITIPFNREELADFLCVDRTALSHELGRMKKDGLIDYKKNIFLIK